MRGVRARRSTGTVGGDSSVVIGVAAAYDRAVVGVGVGVRVDIAAAVRGAGGAPRG